MLLTDLEGQGKAREDLIRDKLAFLQAFPRVSHDRGKAFNRAIAPCDPDNTAGLQQRINLLLGMPDWTFVYRASKSAGPPGFDHTLSLDELGQPIVSFTAAAGRRDGAGGVADRTRARHVTGRTGGSRAPTGSSS